VTYNGTLASTVKMYRGALSGNNGLESDVNLVIERGTATNNACAGWSTASTLYTGTLSGMATTYAGGYTLPNSGGATWTTGNTVWVKITATLSATTPDADQGKTTGTHSFTWEAQNN
jgi:hypothetical protein